MQVNELIELRVLAKYALVYSTQYDYNRRPAISRKRKLQDWLVYQCLDIQSNLETCHLFENYHQFVGGQQEMARWLSGVC